MAGELSRKELRGLPYLHSNLEAVVLSAEVSAQAARRGLRGGLEEGPQ